MSAAFLRFVHYADILEIISLWVDATKCSLNSGPSKGHCVKSRDDYAK